MYIFMLLEYVSMNVRFVAYVTAGNTRWKVESANIQSMVFGSSRWADIYGNCIICSGPAYAISDLAHHSDCRFRSRQQLLIFPIFALPWPNSQKGCFCFPQVAGWECGEFFRGPIFTKSSGNSKFHLDFGTRHHAISSGVRNRDETTSTSKCARTSTIHCLRHLITNVIFRQRAQRRPQTIAFGPRRRFNNCWVIMMRLSEEVMAWSLISLPLVVTSWSGRGTVDIHITSAPVPYCNDQL